MLPGLRVTAPSDTDRTTIAANVRQHTAGIVREQREPARSLPKTPRPYVSAKTQRSLGRQYRRNVVEAERAAVTLTHGDLSVWTPDRTDTARVKELLNACSHTHAERVFPARLGALLPRVQRQALPLHCGGLHHEVLTPCGEIGQGRRTHKRRATHNDHDGRTRDASV